PARLQVRASSNYQLVQVPSKPSELSGKEVYVELSQWYCEQQVIEDHESMSRLLVRGKIVQVEHQRHSWIADIWWGVFNEVSSVKVSLLEEIGARWGVPPGTRELSHEEWCESE